MLRWMIDDLDVDVDAEVSVAGVGTKAGCWPSSGVLCLSL
jgi:hypothetical protein